MKYALLSALCLFACGPTAETDDPLPPAPAPSIATRTTRTVRMVVIPVPVAPTICPRDDAGVGHPIGE